MRVQCEEMEFQGEVRAGASLRWGVWAGGGHVRCSADWGGYAGATQWKGLRVPLRVGIMEGSRARE